MKSFIILFIFIYIYLISTIVSSDDNNNCYQRIDSISEVNPLEIGSLVQVEGLFCLNNTDGINAIFNTGIINNNQILNCNNITLEDTTSTTTFTINNKNYIYNNQILKCTLEQETSGIFNYSSIGSFTLNTPFNQSSSPITYNNYIFTNNSCPIKCKDHGICGIDYICICNKDYVSFDCSHKITNDTIISPTGTSFNSFKMTSLNDIINIKISNILLNISNSDESNHTIQERSIDSLYITEETSTSTSLSFTATSSSWINSIFYNVDYLLRPNKSSSFINFHGSYLPVSTSSALVSLFQTINRTSISPLNSSSTSFYSTILEISNLKEIMNKLTWEISKSENSIIFKNLKSNSLFEISLSDLRVIDGDQISPIIVPNNSKLKLLPNFSTNSTSSIFLSIEIEQPKQFEIKQNSSTSLEFQLQLTFNIYNTPPIVLAAWEIALIVLSSVSGFGFLVLVIVLFIRSRLKIYRLKKNKFDLGKLSINQDHNDEPNEDEPLITSE